MQWITMREEGSGGERFTANPKIIDCPATSAAIARRVHSPTLGASVEVGAGFVQAQQVDMGVTR
jgi:hypothetical protein